MQALCNQYAHLLVLPQCCLLGGPQVSKNARLHPQFRGSLEKAARSAMVRCICAHLWTLELVEGRLPLLILSALVPTVKNATVTSQIGPLVGPSEGKGGVMTSDFGPFLWEPLRAHGLGSISAHPRTPGKVGVMQPPLVLSPYFGPPQGSRGYVAFRALVGP